MSSFTSPELVAAVSNAGGLGIPSGALPVRWRNCATTWRGSRALTADRPFGVNHVLAHLDPEALEITLQSRVPVISTRGAIRRRSSRVPVRGRACCTRSRRPRRPRAPPPGVDVIVAQAPTAAGTSASSARCRWFPPRWTRRAASRFSPRAASPTAAVSPRRSHSGADGVLMAPASLATTEAPDPRGLEAHHRRLAGERHRAQRRLRSRGRDGVAGRRGARHPQPVPHRGGRSRG